MFHEKCKMLVILELMLLIEVSVCALNGGSIEAETKATSNVLVSTSVDKDSTSKPSSSAPIVTGADDIIRCFCNLPRCVSTGYMCQTARSSSGGCFSELRYSEDKSVPKHGCIEILQEDNKRTYTQCDNAPREYGKAFEDSLILCCYEDMCNGHDQKRFQPNLTTDVDGNGFIYTSPSETIHRRFPTLQSTAYSNNSELWFKAATIAFPVIGAVILFALIALALRILKTDNLQSSTAKLSNVAGCSGLTTTNALSPQRNKQHQYADYEQTYGASTAVNIGLTSTLNDTCAVDNDRNCQRNENEKPLLTPSPIVASVDMKNEQFAHKNNLSSLEYHLLPQHCYETTLKPNNLDISNSNDANGNATSNLYRILVNLNYSPLQSNNNRTANGFIDTNKIYEKSTISPNNYWILNTKQNQDYSSK